MNPKHENPNAPEPTDPAHPPVCGYPKLMPDKCAGCTFGECPHRVAPPNDQASNWIEYSKRGGIHPDPAPGFPNVECHGCGWGGPLADSRPLTDADRREIPAGGTMPHGGCPECGGWVYESDPTPDPEPSRDVAWDCANPECFTRNVHVIRPDDIIDGFARVECRECGRPEYVDPTADPN